MKRLYYWLGQQVQHPYAAWLFAGLVFIEGFFFVPVNTLLSIFCLNHRKQAFFYATIASLASFGGSFAGYFIGAGLWKLLGQALINCLSSPDYFMWMIDQYRINQVWAAWCGGFLPIPYKMVTISAGFCQVPVLFFVMYASMARTLRFFAIATILYVWGEWIAQIIDRYFYSLVLCGIGFLVLGWWFLR